MKPIREEIKETLKSRQELILQDKRLYTNQVAEMLGVTRHTVLNYLEKGAALRISPQEFKMRFDTSIPHYFLGKYNRVQKTVSCMRFGDYYYVIKL